jgi:hypothetical protein
MFQIYPFFNLSDSYIVEIYLDSGRVILMERVKNSKFMPKSLYSAYIYIYYYYYLFIFEKNVHQPFHNATENVQWFVV